MTRRATIAGGVFAIVLVLIALAVANRALEQDDDPAPETAPSVTTSIPSAEEAQPSAETFPGFIYGRVTTKDGATFEGRLRWGRNQEAFWDDYFNGSKQKNLWVAHVPQGRLPEERVPIEILGVKIASWKKTIDVDRQFMARFGEISRVESRGDDVRVTLKSGSVFDLDRYFASDLDDGVRVWDARRGVVDLDSLRIRAIDLLATPRPGATAYRLHGTVRTKQGDFTGFVLWNRREAIGSDELDGITPNGERSLRFDTIRSIERRPHGSLVTLHDGREVVFSGSPEVDGNNRGVFVDDPRYGRVLISWDTFERVDFSPGGSVSVYDDFPPGRPLTGSVTTRDGRRLAGRLIYDLNESETTDTLDAPSQGLHYNIPFGRVASIVPAGQLATVTLHNGEELELEGTGELGATNGGMLVFAEGSQSPEYILWTDVKQVDFDRSGKR